MQVNPALCSRIDEFFCSCCNILEMLDYVTQSEVQASYETFPFSCVLLAERDAARS